MNVNNYKVRLVIPCRNEEEYIGRCLESIVKCNYPKEHLSVVVSDGMSSDKTKIIIESYTNKYPFIQMMINEQKTTPHAMNIGLRDLNFDVGIICGAHAEIDTEFISKSVSILFSDDKIKCVGGFIQNVHENEASRIISLAMSTPFGVGNAHFRTGNKSGFVDTVAFGAYKREVFEKIGFFDEELIRNQDDEFNFRMTKNEMKIFLEPEIKSLYYVRGSYGKLFRQYFQYGYWKVFVNRKHKAITTLRQLAPPLWVLFLLTGWTSVFIHHNLFLIYAGLFGLYFLIAIYYAIHKLNKVTDIPFLLLTFFILHFSYGFGYLKGIFHFYLINKKPSVQSQKLTR